ncbi:MAG TPA: CHAT domain-containing tetratricopeptide repeat protein [Pyrinomonadaceae bacterium]
MKFKVFLAGSFIACVVILHGSRVPTVSAHSLNPVAAPALLPPQQNDQANAALQQGRTLLKQGKADQAISYLSKALKLFTESKNARGVAAAEDQLGDLYLRQGQYTVALDHYRKAYEAFRSGEMGDATTGAAAGAANVAGATAGALAETAATANADNGFNANLMLAKIGDTNYRLGKLPEASAAYAQMYVTKPEGVAAKATRRFGGLGGIMGGISTGRVSVEAPTSAAIGLLEVKKELDEYRIATVYMTYELGMGRIEFAGNNLEAAKKHFQNALDAGNGSLPGVGNLGQTRRFRAAARTSLADVALRLGNYKDAIKFYSEAAKGAKADKRLDLMWPAQRGAGRSNWLQAAQEKDQKKAASIRESALASYRDAIATIETLRAGSLRADESRTTFLATTKDVFDEASSAMAETALLNAPAPGTPLSGKALDYAAEAFKVTEEGRARSLLDMLSETNAQVTAGVPADLLKRKQDNLDRQQEIAQQLTGISLSSDPQNQQKQRPSDLDSELDKLQTEFDDIENQIRTASPRYAALTAAQPQSLAEVQQKVLDEGTVLLEYSLGSDASYLWAVTSASVFVYKLPPRAMVDKLVTDLRAQLIPSKLQRRIVGIDVAANQQRGLGLGVDSVPENVSAFVAAASVLYKAVVEPAASVIGEKRLLVVADGALNYVPFEAMVKSAEGTDYASLGYLVKTNEIVYAPSASVIAAIRQQRNKTAGKSFLLVADPVFNSNDPRAKGTVTASAEATAEARGLGLESAVEDVAGESAQSSSSAQGLQLARLAGTRAEAEQIGQLVKKSGGQSDLWLDLKASEDDVKSHDIQNYRVIHFATHGLLNADRPQFTGLVLSLVGNKNNDGFLRTDEVFNMNVGAPLVMLSACETGLGKEKRGEGVIGLTRAFMYAGAPTVGVSLWSVADKSTAELMTDFYRRLLGPPAGLSTVTSPAAAMREAQLAMITGKKYSAPFYWAPFVLIGDWR